MPPNLTVSSAHPTFPRHSPGFKFSSTFHILQHNLRTSFSSLLCCSPSQIYPFPAHTPQSLTHTKPELNSCLGRIAHNTNAPMQQHLHDLCVSQRECNMPFVSTYPKKKSNKHTASSIKHRRRASRIMMARRNCAEGFAIFCLCARLDPGGRMSAFRVQLGDAVAVCVRAYLSLWWG